MICKNCGHTFKGNFCNNCGQKSNIGKITLKQTFESIINGLFQLDRGYLFTVKELIIRPGQCIRHYITGKRRKYFNPFSLILISSLVLLLVNYLTNYELEVISFSNGMIEGFSAAEGPMNTIVLFEKIVNWFSGNYAYLILCFLPITSLSTYIAFRKEGYSYLEHIVLNAYLNGIEIIILICISLLSPLVKTESLLVSGQIYLSLFYSFWVYFQFFNTKKWWSRLLHSIQAYFYYCLFAVITIAILVFITAIILD